jgi:predicted NAD/FAD-dependent oxidoreductase
VAVIGAGLAGLSAAIALEDQGHEVVVVDKARGPGGRMATRRHQAWRFDHGAQYFTARDPRFLQQVLEWRKNGHVEPWDGRIGVVENGRIAQAPVETERFVAVPGMSSVCRELTGELANCRFEWRVRRAAWSDGVWRLATVDGRTLEADALVITTPPDQVAPLLADPDLLAAVGQALHGLAMEPCWALMAVFGQPLLAEWDAAFVNEGALGWVCNQAAKPGRPAAPAWVLHATSEWSRVHLETDAAQVVDMLLDAARLLPGAANVQAEFAKAHRWRYSRASHPLESGALWFDRQRLALAGDWCAGSRVEGAFLSGAAAAHRINRR